MEHRKPLKRASWPKELIMPTASEFVHQNWVELHVPKLEGADAASDEEFDERDDLIRAIQDAGCGDAVEKKHLEAMKYNCNTRCCLVGWACFAFDEDGVAPEAVRNPATAKFLNKFLEFADARPVEKMEGYTSERFMFEVAERASDCFEGEASRGFYSDLSPKRAARLWKKTAAYFGYTEDAK